MTSEPKSSASTYSQGSWTNSPVSFSEARVNRRRFAIAISPSQDGPWKHPPPSANTSVSAVQLQRARSKKSADNVQHEGRDVEGKKKKKKKRIRNIRPKTPIILSAAPISHSRSTRMFGRMFPRRMAPPPQSAGAVLEPVIIIEAEQPRLPALPPQVLVTLPSPELNITDDFAWLGGDDSSVAIQSRSDELQPIAPRPVTFHPTSKTKSRSSSILKRYESPVQPKPAHPSDWKPKRPPSPVPSGMRRNSKAKPMHKTLISLSSPPPPVPALIKYNTSAVPKSRATFSIPLSPPPPYQLHSLLRPMQSRASDNETTLEMYLKARASKSANYALHDGGIFSPTSS
jgi:hypothetical protein